MSAPRRATRRPAGIAALLLALVSTGCGEGGAGREFRAGDVLPPTEMLERIPLGALAGAADTRIALRIRNPYEGDRNALREGELLFTRMNCVGCHGYSGGGGMGPDLSDTHWRYGGTPAEIFLSVYEGRPKGMPAYGRMLPEGQIWQIAAYVESLGPGLPGPTVTGDFPGPDPTGTDISQRHRGTQAQTASQ